MKGSRRTPEELDALIAEERAAIHDMVDRRLVPLVVRRRMLADEMARRASPAREGSAARPRPARLVSLPVRDDVSAELLATALRRSDRWPAARIVMEMLEAGPEDGVAGREIDARLTEWGHPLDGAESTKARLGHLGAVEYQADRSAWRVTPAYRSAIPAGSRIVLGASDRGRTPHPAAQAGGRVIIEAMALDPEAGFTKEDLVRAVVAAGYSRSLGRHAQAALATGGYIERSGEEGKWKLSMTGWQEWTKS